MCACVRLFRERFQEYEIAYGDAGEAGDTVSNCLISKYIPIKYYFTSKFVFQRTISVWAISLIAY